jgi:hypothetical protein
MHRATFEKLLALGAHFRQQWQELAVIPHDLELVKFLDKIRRRNARALGLRISR